MLDGELPVNHAILGNLQDVFNLLPNLSTPKTSPITNGISQGVPAADNSELARAMSVKTNDQLMAIYLSSLIRAITAFHDLIENKIQNKQQAEDRDQKVEDDKVDKKIRKEEKLMLIGEGGTAAAKEGEKKDGKEESKGKGKEGAKKG